MLVESYDPGGGGTHIFSWIRDVDVDGWVLKGLCRQMGGSFSKKSVKFWQMDGFERKILVDRGVQEQKLAKKWQMDGFERQILVDR